MDSDIPIYRCIEDALGQDGELARALVQTLRRDFLTPLADKLETITFRKLISRKNPYLYRAIGIDSVDDLVDRALSDFVSSSVEGLFGKILERLVTALPGCIKSSAEGVDVKRRFEDSGELYAIKSGPAGYTSSSLKRQREDLANARARLQQERGVAVHPFFGFAYGRKRTGTPRQGIITLSSKELWKKLSGDTDFYRKLLDALACARQLYRADVGSARNRLLQEAREGFAQDGRIDWPTVLKASSG